MKKNIRIAVTGAAGQIGYALLFRIASGAMFGPETKIDLNLLELASAKSALDGVVMEIEDCAFPLINSVCPTTDINKAFKDVDWALLVGSVPRKAGMERSDLLKINGPIFVSQGQALSQHALPSAKVLVVGNPCNTNALIAKANAKNLDPANFFALTMLDQTRAIAQLAQKANVSSEEIKNLAIWGNHSATQFPDFTNAKIEDKAVSDVIDDETWLQTQFIETVQKRGAAIIKARGLSSAASAANAVVETVRCINEPTKKGGYFSLAVVSDGSYGITPGLVFSYPVRSDGKKWEIIKNLPLNAFAQEKIDITHKELLKEQELVKEFTDNK